LLQVEIDGEFSGILEEVKSKLNTVSFKGESYQAQKGTRNMEAQVWLHQERLKEQDKPCTCCVKYLITRQKRK